VEQRGKGQKEIKAQHSKKKQQNIAKLLTCTGLQVQVSFICKYTVLFSALTYY